MGLLRCPAPAVPLPPPPPPRELLWDGKFFMRPGPFWIRLSRAFWMPWSPPDPNFASAPPEAADTHEGTVVPAAAAAAAGWGTGTGAGTPPAAAAAAEDRPTAAAAFPAFKILRIRCWSSDWESFPAAAAERPIEDSASGFILAPKARSTFRTQNNLIINDRSIKKSQK